IRRRGENISSLEVEEVLKREPRIMDCAVIGVPSELAEEEVKAYVVVRPGERMKPEEVVYWCADRLATFKVPRYVEFRAELPRTPSLRVQKELLRQESPDVNTACFDREKAGIRWR
ncbi:MAG: ATP-dependent acyl-CoA ligase, partial [Candidatus Binatia bacterium]